MDNGVNVADVGTLAGLRGISYGYGNNGNFLGDGSAINAGVRGNRDISLLESVNKGTRDQFLSSQIRQHNDSISDRIGTSENFLSAQISDQSSEFRFANITSQFASLERQMIANQATLIAALHAQDLKQVECCCELKAGQATIIANQESARLQDAQAENVRLRNEITIMNSARTGGGGGN